MHYTAGMKPAAVELLPYGGFKTLRAAAIP